VNAGKNQTICSGYSAQLGSTAVSGNNYSWTSSPSGYTNTTANPSVSPTAATTYYLAETITATGCSNTDTTIVTVNPLPKAYAGSNQSICAGSSASIGGTAISGDTYSWTSNPVGFTSTNAGASPSPTITTTYYLTESAGASCSKTDSVIITVNPLPSVNAGKNETICAGNAAQLGSTAISGDTYSWTSSPSGYTNTTANPSVSPTATTTYYLTETITATGCSNTDTVIVTVNPLPKAYAGSSQSICAGSTVNIGSTAVSGNAYSWASNPVGFTSTVSNPSVSPTINTTYYLTESAGASCSKTDSVVITVNPLPTANAGTNQSICYGSSVSIGATAISGNAYLWTSNPKGFTNTNSNINVSPTITTTYYLVESITATGCSNNDSVIITVNPLPTINAGTNQSICYGGSASIGATAISGESYLWTSNPKGFTNTNSNINVSPTITTTYYLAESITATGCSNNDSVIITVNPLPTINAGTNQSICYGSSVSIGATAISGNTYLWTSNPVGFTSTVAGASPAPTVTTTYTLTETISATGCSKTDSVTITVNPLPKAIAGSNTAICVGASATIGATAISGDSYSWVSNPSGFTSTGAGASPAPISTTTYTLTETVTATGCSNSNSVVITVNPLPLAKIGNTTFVCLGSGATIGSSAVSGDNYTWTSSPKGFTSTIANPSISPTVNTTYYLRETITTTGCSKSDTLVVTVGTKLSVIVPPNDTVCSLTSPILLSGKPSGGVWSGNGVIDTFGRYYFYPKQATGLNTLKYTVTSSGCGSAYDSFNIYVYQSPSIKITPINNICVGSTGFNLSATPAGGVWSGGPAGALTASGLLNPAKATPGTYKIYYSYGYPGGPSGKQGYYCGAIDSTTLTVDSVPAISFTTTTHGDTVSFTPNNQTYTGYEWNFGDNASSGSDTSSLVKPSHIYTNNGVYKTSLSVTDKNGCTGADTVSVTMNYTGINNLTAIAADIKLIPNPFKNTVLIEYSLPENSQLRAGVYDVTGQEIAELFNGYQDAGLHQLYFDATKYNAAAGIYFLRMVINGGVVNIKMVRD